MVLAVFHPLLPLLCDFHITVSLVRFLVENVTLMKVSVRMLQLYHISNIPPIICDHISFIYQ